jgi:DNA-directed RNA polymerase subunit E'/Rpb7
VSLTPENLCREWEETVLKNLRRQLQGRLHARFGFVISIISSNVLGLGRTNDVTGEVDYTCEVTALCFYPIKGEVMEGTVSDVTMEDISVTIPCVEVRIFKHNFPKEKDVQDHVVKDVYKFEEGEGNEKKWVPSKEGSDRELKLHTRVRFRVDTVNRDSQGIVWVFPPTYKSLIGLPSLPFLHDCVLIVS